MSATAEYTDMLQQRLETPQSELSVSNRENNEPQMGDTFRSSKYSYGNSGGGGVETRERLVKSGVLKDLRGKLATTEQKLRVVQADFVTKCDEVRKLLAKVSRLEKEKSAALQKQIDALPKSSKKKAKASIWSKLEMDTKKRDARFSQILQHYEILEGQYNNEVKIREELEEELSKTRGFLHRKELENTSLREEHTSMTVQEQRNRLEFLECMKSLQELKRSYEASQADCTRMKEVIMQQENTITKQADEIAKMKKVQEKTLKEKVRKDHKIGSLQKKIQKFISEIELLKKTQESYESDYYNLEERMKVLRKRNSFLELNLDKANRITDDAKKTVEMKEQECKLMADIINDSRRSSMTSTSSLAPQFSFPVYNNGAEHSSKGREVSPPVRKSISPHRRSSAPTNVSSTVSPVNLFKSNPLSPNRRNTTPGMSLEDELAELVCSPDSLDSQGEDEET